MNITLLLRLSEKLWKFSLDNPEIAIFLATALFGGLTWLGRNYFGQAKRWLCRMWQSLAGRKVIGPTPPPQQWFVNVGEHRGHMRWEDCVRYGCISAGGGARYARAIQRLELGSTIYAYISRYGYVGCGEVVKKAVPIKEFTVMPENKPLLEMSLLTSGLDRNQNNEDNTTWVAGIKWLKTFGSSGFPVVDTRYSVRL
jgi:hypothetical protein